MNVQEYALATDKSNAYPQLSGTPVAPPRTELEF